MVVSSSKQVLTDKWIKATWKKFIEIAYDPTYIDCSAYFYSEEMRIEMPSLGVGHSRQNSVVSNVITLFAACYGMDITSYTNGRFHKTGEKEGAKYLPPQNNLPVSIDLCGLPDLVVEVGASSIKDDLGRKRLMYERIGIREYWVVDVEAKEVFAFSIADGRSGRIQLSVVLPGLELG